MSVLAQKPFPEKNFSFKKLTSQLREELMALYDPPVGYEQSFIAPKIKGDEIPQGPEERSLYKSSSQLADVGIVLLNVFKSLEKEDSEVALAEAKKGVITAYAMTAHAAASNTERRVALVKSQAFGISSQSLQIGGKDNLITEELLTEIKNIKKLKDETGLRKPHGQSKPSKRGRRGRYPQNNNNNNFQDNGYNSNQNNNNNYNGQHSMGGYSQNNNNNYNNNGNSYHHRGQGRGRSVGRGTKRT